MKIFVGGLLLLLIMTTLTGIEWRRAHPSISATVKANQQKIFSSQLTLAEESDLRKLADQTLSWIATWEPSPWNCLNNGRVTELNMPAIFQQHQGQAIEMRLTVRETNLTAYLVTLHLKFTVARLHDLGLGTPNLEYYCEETYEDRVLAETQEATRMQESKREIEKQEPIPRPNLPELVRRDQEKLDGTKVPGSNEPRQEVRNYSVPSIVETTTSDKSIWDSEKKTLYERLTTAIKNKIEEDHCGSIGAVRAIIPDFDARDPAIYVLVVPQKREESSIEWFNVIRQFSDGQYDTYHMKSIDLSDNTKIWRSTIEKRKVGEVNVVCKR